jgi:MFS family permease
VRELLSARDFRVLLGAQLLAQCADGIAQAAFADLILLEPGAQGTPRRIVAVFTLTLVPYSIIAPFLGVLVDRWDRRKLLAGTNVSRGLVLVTLPLWSKLVPGRVAPYAALLVLLGFGRLFLTTKGAVLPVVLHEHHLLRGNAASGGGGMIAGLLGGVIGLSGAAVLRATPIFFAAGVVYGISALISLRLPAGLTPLSKPGGRFGDALARVARELLAGLREVWSRRPARISLASIFVLRSAVMLTAIAALLVIKTEFPASGDRFGRLSAGALALGVSSVGAFIAALSASPLGRRLGNAGLILFGFVVSGVGITALGGILDVRAVLGLTAVGGYGAYVAKIATDAEIQEAVPDAFRGRAFSLYDILYNLASVAAAAVMVAFDQQSFRAVLVPAGAVTIGLAGLVAVAMRRAGMLHSGDRR